MRYLLIAFAMLVVVPEIALAQSCRELRLACEMKNELGEQGRGNCRAYREQCQQGPDCASLRQACMFKNELGEQGRGNCRAYREQCAGR
jgi:hypothetical protein